MSAIKIYRLANKLYKLGIPLIPNILYRLIYIINNCHVHYSTQIGEGTNIAYGGIGVVIHKNAKIGKDCVISSCVTIGWRSNLERLPIIGNNVYIGTGARVLGNINIGDNVIIGANAVVIDNVPSNCIVAGVPARIIEKNVDISKKCNLNSIIEINK